MATKIEIHNVRLVKLGNRPQSIRRGWDVKIVVWWALNYITLSFRVSASLEVANNPVNDLAFKYI